MKGTVPFINEKLTPASIQHVLGEPRDIAANQEPVATLSSVDDLTLQEVHSLHDVPETWKT